MMPDAENTYIRIQTTSLLGMDKVDKASIDGLKADGARLWTENEAGIQKMLREIIDERFGPSPTA
jgi:hypothetical protein